MKRKQIIIGIDKQIKVLSKLKKENEKELKWARKLPDDPSLGQDLSKYFKHDVPGILNENPHLKLDYLENFYGSVKDLKNNGLSLGEIIKKLDRRDDRFVKWLTLNNACFANMVRSAYRFALKEEDGQP